MLRKGKDVVLNDVMAFDLKLWDSQAVTRVTPDGTTVTPSDPGYRYGTNLLDANGEGTGAYVDLGFAVIPKAISNGAFPPGEFGTFPHPKSTLGMTTLPNALVNGLGVATYDTWSSSYERDGVNQDGDAFVDEGHDGLDNPEIYPGDSSESLKFGVDDPGEAETSPPYPHSLSGLKVIMRTIDFSTRQVRQTSVIKDFLPE